MQKARLLFSAAVLLVLVIGTVSAQTTAFTYQGSLKDGANAANGNYDFQFALFDAVSGGTQQGSTLSQNSVAVANGIFTVSLDFGSQFPGATRFLEIRVRLTGGGTLTTLAPRQPVNSSPYSVKTLNAGSANNATQLGGISASGFIQNGTSVQAANQNISGNAYFGGNVGVGTTSPSAKVDVVGGIGTGVHATSTSSTAVLGGSDNSNGVFGVTGTGIGVYGQTVGSGFAGKFDGPVYMNGNVGVGTSTPDAMLQVVAPGNQNGVHASSGSAGYGVYGTSPDGTGVVGIGSASGDGVRGLGNTGSGVEGMSTSGTGVEGFSTSGTGVYGQSAAASLTAAGVYGVGTASGSIGVIGQGNIGTGTGVFGVSSSSTGYGVYARNTSAGGTALYVDGTVALGNLGGGGNISLCLNGSTSLIKQCSSSLRYKKNIGNYSLGMSFVNQLHPITFDWKDGGMKDVGFGAEDIEKIDPRFVTYNKTGQLEGVKYDRLSVAFVNAFKEQQTMIETQQEQNAQQQRQIDKQNAINKNQQSEIDALKALVCANHRTAPVCRARK